MIPGMMSDDDRKVAALIVGDGKEEEAIDSDESVGLDTAIEEMFVAMESKDKAGFKSALKSFMQLCKDEVDSESEASYDME